MFDQITKQQQLEKLYNKNQTIPRIKEEIQGYENGYILDLICQAGLDEKFGIDLLTQMILHKRTNLETLVGVLRHHAQDSPQEIVEMIELALDHGLVEYNEVTRQFIVAIDIPDDVQWEIDAYQYPFPMIIPPSPVKNNKQSGYLSIDTHIILKKNRHNDDVVLDHINRANSIPFEINTEVVTHIQNEWRNLDKKKQGETIWEFQDRKKAFEKYDRTAKAVIDLLVENTDVIYFTHRYDFRGRIYCQGYHLNYAGNSWNKACVSLANKEKVND